MAKKPSRNDVVPSKKESFPPLQLLGGSITWLAEGKHAIRGTITGASLQHGNRLVINIEDRGIYSVELARGFGEDFTGHWSCRYGSNVVEGRVAGRLMETMGNYFWFGEWHEDGLLYHWWGDLTSKEDTDDEE